MAEREKRTNRVEILDNVLENTFERFEKDLGKRFSDWNSLPAAIRNDATFLREAAAVTNKIILTRAKDKINSELDEHQIRAKLSELDEVERKQTKSETKAWRPSGKAEDDLAAHKIVVLRRKTEETKENLLKPLEDRIKNLEEEIENIERVLEDSDQQTDKSLSELWKEKKKKYIGLANNESEQNFFTLSIERNP